MRERVSWEEEEEGSESRGCEVKMRDSRLWLLVMTRTDRVSFVIGQGEKFQELRDQGVRRVFEVRKDYFASRKHVFTDLAQS